MLWHEMNGKTVGIWGSGREGQAALNAVKKYAQPVQTLVFDDSSTDQMAQCDCVITSPGVSLYKPEIVAARRKGIIFTTGSDLFLANKPADKRVIAVTGTKGKSTTTALIYHLLKSNGYAVALGGNIGTPLLDLADDPAMYIVAELSSYQCAGLTHGSDVAVILNLYPEHLQWHGSHERYFADKVNLARLSQKAVVNGMNEILCGLVKDLSDVVYFNAPTGWHLENGFFCMGAERILPIDTLHLKGTHNAQNACACLAALEQAGIRLSPNQIAQAFQTMQALPHRMQPVGTSRGLSFIDDSISTTPESTWAALQTFSQGQPITLICGGFDRGQVYDELAERCVSLKNVLTVITLPDTGDRIASAMAKCDIKTLSVQTMAEAVSAAFRVTPAGGVVLLSPAAPSYNMYRNFEERGADFVRQIKEI